jgi:hypothetical protein
VQEGGGGSSMGWWFNFYRTWVPGYNTEYVDPFKVASMDRKLKIAKKVAVWMFALTLIGCLIFLLTVLFSKSGT